MSVLSTLRTTDVSAKGLPACSYTSDVHAAAAMLPSLTEAVVRTLLDVNRGRPGSNMTTLGLAMAVSSEQVYKMKDGKLEIDLTSAAAARVIDLEERASHPHRIKTPPYLEIAAVWDDKTLSSGAGNNSLGDNGRLILEPDLIEIPTVEATDAMLAYYGATLVEEGELVRFSDKEFPIFQLEVGDGYVKDTLMTDAGGGFYLEYHTDQPHFHLVVSGSGYYLLARWNEDKTKLQITAFHIPNGKAVYSKKGAIHCDAALTGNLLVGYTTSEDCSTVLLQNKTGERIDVKFVDFAATKALPLGVMKV